MAQHGSPGIHAGRPTTQNLLSASRRGGQIKSTARRGGRPAGLVGGLHSRSVAADEPCEAAFGGVAVVKSASSVYQVNRVFRFCDRCVIERSLALLVSGLYVALKRFAQGSVASAMDFAFAFAFAFAGATRMSRRRECPSQKAERRCCYGGGAAGRRASRDGPWMARRGVPP